MRIADGVVRQRGIVRLHHAEQGDIAIGQVAAHTLDDKLKLGVTYMDNGCLDSLIGHLLDLGCTKPKKTLEVTQRFIQALYGDGHVIDSLYHFCSSLLFYA